MYEFLLYVFVALWVIARYYYFRKNRKPHDPVELNENTFAEYDAIVQAQIPYYGRLTPEGKRHFISRLVRILKEVPIRGKDGFEVTAESKVLIAGCITQLTAGFDTPGIPFLAGVSIYPEIFFSRLLNAWVKGIALGNGAVFISWKHFIEGYANSEDTYNLGLHEFAHILRFQSQELSLYDERLSSYFEEWERIGTPVFMQTRSREQDFFREYGGVNKVEFFSVCIENFFEAPEKFEQELPELYYHLCYLMKQNPLNKTGDYVFSTEQIEKANRKITTHVPVYAIWLSERELLFWELFAKGNAFVFGAILFFFMFLPASAKIGSIRALVISLLILITLRWIFYNDMNAVTNKRYIRHMAFKLVPVMAFVVLLFKVIFVE